jgi:RNA polymerase sigma-70 factor (ECF subfamily)
VRELQGAVAVAREAAAYSKVADVARPALVDRTVGFVVAPRGRLRIAVRCTVKAGKIIEMNVIADPARLQRLKVSDPDF